MSNPLSNPSDRLQKQLLPIVEVASDVLTKLPQLSGSIKLIFLTGGLVNYEVIFNDKTKFKKSFETVKS